MILATSDSVPGKRITEVKGLVQGNTIRARNIGRDIVAGLRNIVGGEVTEYTRLMAESREQAIMRMTEQAEGLGANAVVGDEGTSSRGRDLADDPGDLRPYAGTDADRIVPRRRGDNQLSA